MGSMEGGLPGSVEGPCLGFVPRYLEGQNAVTIQHVSCGDLFTACLTGTTKSYSDIPVQIIINHVNNCVQWCDETFNGFLQIEES